MHWLYMHVTDIGFCLLLLSGIFTVYLGTITIKRRKKGLTGNVLTGPELTVGMVLLLAGVFILGIHAVHNFS